MLSGSPEINQSSFGPQKQSSNLLKCRLRPSIGKRHLILSLTEHLTAAFVYAGVMRKGILLFVGLGLCSAVVQADIPKYGIVAKWQIGGDGRWDCLHVDSGAHR